MLFVRTAKDWCRATFETVTGSYGILIGWSLKSVARVDLPITWVKGYPMPFLCLKAFGGSYGNSAIVCGRSPIVIEGLGGPCVSPQIDRGFPDGLAMGDCWQYSSSLPISQKGSESVDRLKFLATQAYSLKWLYFLRRVYNSDQREVE